MKSNALHEEIRSTAKKLLQKELLPRLEGHEEAGTFDHETLRRLGQAGLAAPLFSEPYGSGDLLAQIIVSDEMGYASSGFGLSALASVGLFGSNIDRLGTHEQKEKYLPSIASGEKIGSWALTEPAVGSDAISIKTRCEQRGDRFLLNGSKTFITNAPIADYFIILARNCGPDGKPLAHGFEGATALILERGMTGLRTGKPFKKLGHLSSPTGEVFMENVEVPMSQVLGKPGQAFFGMKISLDYERAVFGGLGLGLMRFCLDQVVHYGATRKQFGVPILEHQMIQEKIADMASAIDVTEVYLYSVADKLIRGEKATQEAAIAKLMGSRLAMQVASDAVQCLGGYGYMREYQVERCLRDAKLFEIGGGTSEIQKMIIAKEAIKTILEGV